jgi:acetyl esterase/lipase
MMLFGLSTSVLIAQGNADPKTPDAAATAKAKSKGQSPIEGVREYSRPPDLVNVSYGPHERNVLDLWKAKSDHPTPLVVFLHPGGFTHGDKRGERTGLPPNLLDLCLAKGISVATANYHYSRQAPFPAQLHDAARVIQFLRYHAREWNLNPNAVASTGASAGAGMSLWLAFRDDLADPKSDDPVLRESTRLPVVGSVDGQSSYDPRFIAKLVGDQTVREWAGPEALAPLFGLPRNTDLLTAEKAFPLYEDASAINFVKAGATPVFLYYTTPPKALPVTVKNEGIHNYRFGVALKEKMDLFGNECVLHHSGEYPGADRNLKMYTDMVEFFVRHFPQSTP